MSEPAYCKPLLTGRIPLREAALTHVKPPGTHGRLFGMSRRGAGPADAAGSRAAARAERRQAGWAGLHGRSACKWATSAIGTSCIHEHKHPGKKGCCAGSSCSRRGHRCRSGRSAGVFSLGDWRGRQCLQLNERCGWTQLRRQASFAGLERTGWLGAGTAWGRAPWWPCLLPSRCRRRQTDGVWLRLCYEPFALLNS